MDRTVFAVAGSFAMKPGVEKGIRVFSFNEEDGSLELLSKSFPEINSGALAYDPLADMLYVTDESMMHDGVKGNGGQIHYGHVTEGGGFELGGKRDSLGSMPSFICVDAARRQLLVPHHGQGAAVPKLQQNGDGSYCVVPESEDTGLILFELNEDGSVGDARDVFVPEGTAPHLHNCILSPDGDFALVCDKGLDKIHIMKLTDKKMQLVCDIEVEEGSAPRYSCFHPHMPVFYQNNESRAFINVWTWDPGRAFLTRIQVIALLGDEEKAASWKREGASDLLITPDGKYLYATLRGFNVLAIYKIGEDGTLTLLENVSCAGENPRGLALSPDGRFLLVLNRDTEEIVTFEIGSDGRLTDTGNRAHCPAAACLNFIIR